MAKKVVSSFKLQLEAGKATPAPPVGPACGQRGVNIMEFCKAFNEKTQSQAGFRIPVICTVYADKTFSLETKQPPMTNLIKHELNLKKGSENALKVKVGKLTRDQIMNIVKAKIADMNTKDPEMAAKIVAGSARSMGIEVEL